MIETTRLFLRPHSVDDFEPLYAVTGDAEFMKFIGAGVPATREDAWRNLQRFAGHWAFFSYGLFAIVDKQTGAYIGHTGLAHFHRGLGGDFDSAPEAAWGLSVGHQGKGYLTEAAEAAHGWFDRQFKPGRTVCIIDAENAPSLRVAERLDYRPYGETVYKEKTVIKFERLTANGD